jgi:transposase InsO family protein
MAMWQAIQLDYYGITQDDLEDLLEHCQNCQKCLLNRSRGPLRPIVSSKNFERVQVDLINMSNHLDGQYKWILHAKDHYSKFSLLWPLEAKTVESIARCFHFWIGIFGKPDILQCDNRTEFKGTFKELLLRQGIEIINGRPYTPHHQGLVEKGNNVVKNKLFAWRRKYGSNKWASALPTIAKQIKKSWSSATRYTPWELVFGFAPKH